MEFFLFILMLVVSLALITYSNKKGTPAQEDKGVYRAFASILLIILSLLIINTGIDIPIGIETTGNINETLINYNFTFTEYNVNNNINYTNYAFSNWEIKILSISLLLIGLYLITTVYLIFSRY